MQFISSKSGSMDDLPTDTLATPCDQAFVRSGADQCNALDRFKMREAYIR